MIKSQHFLGKFWSYVYRVVVCKDDHAGFCACGLLDVADANIVHGNLCGVLGLAMPGGDFRGAVNVFGRWFFSARSYDNVGARNVLGMKP